MVWFIDNKKRRGGLVEGGGKGGGEDTQDPFLVPVTKHPELKIAQLGVCWEAPSFQESLEPHVTEDTSSELEGASHFECYFCNLLFSN